jgi:ABC-type dipeptide/oligopeptide/nickel transport system ATPase component
LSVEDLRTHFFTDDGVVKAVDGVSYSIDKGKVLGVVGESGCGKSVTALSIMRLIAPPGRIASGRIMFEGRDLLALPEHEMRTIRGNNISMIFQEPMTSLNPVFTVGNHQRGDPAPPEEVRAGARERSIDMLNVKVPAPEQRIDVTPTSSPAACASAS